MFQLNLSSSDSSMKTYRIQEKKAYEDLREKGHTEPYQGYGLPDIGDFYLDTNGHNNKDIFDSYLGAEILLPNPDEN